jgi:uncharacterized protein
VEITWDATKVVLNQLKHDVSFEEAATVLGDPLAETFLDVDENENRFITIGHSSKNRVLLVVWCERSQNLIRIISARKATKRERAIYEKGI